MNKAFIVLSAGIIFSIGSLTVGFAQEAQEQEAAEAPEMTQEQKDIQARMQEYTTPTENHKVLEQMAGNWKTDVKFWMDPKGPVQEAQGTSEGKMIMNGRFLEQTYKGEMMGQSFEGRGLYGYDNLRKEYTTLWFDSMATGIMTSSAKYDPATKTFSEEGTMSCPITNEAHRWYRAVATFKDADHYTYESYMKDKDGKEFRGMLIEYTRS